MNASSSRPSTGFTLIEVLITVAIISILAAVAYPSYREHVFSSRRAAAAACLQEFAQAFERHYTAQLSYPTTLPALSCSGSTETGPYYTYSRVAGLPAGSYEIWASPTGSQSADRCGTLTLNHLGQRGVINTTSTPASTCWRQ